MGAGPQVGTGFVDGDGGNFLQGGTRQQPREDQVYGFYALINLGEVE